MSIDTETTYTPAAAEHEDDTTIYPESDGKPMADNTLQFRWIVTIQGGLDALFQDDPNVFVAGDLLWYPVKGNNRLCAAPDAMVVFGRPKGERRSYLQWREDNLAPQVVFEVLSPNNTLPEMVNKLRFYETYGVDEFYVYDPDHGSIDGWLRGEHKLEPIETVAGWTSPRLGVRFEIEQDELAIYRPDGRKFASYLELERQREQEHQRAEQEHQRAEQEHQRAEKLAARLRELGIDPAQIDQENIP
jgi:Uma2 family endonuclease